MTIQQHALDYAMKVGARPGYVEQLRVLTKRLPWDVKDLTVKKIDQYLTRALHTLAPQTVQNHRRMLITLRRAALRDGLLVDECTDRVRRVKCDLPLPRAWSHPEIRTLIQAAQHMPGGTRHCKWSILMPAWIKFAYSSGLRLGDILAVRHDALRGNRLAVVMQKTGRPHVVMLDDQTIHAIATLPRKGPRMFGDLVGRCVFIRAFRRLVKRAGMTGSGKYLRRSSATYAAIAGMSPTEHLGHITPGLAQRNYVDPVLVAELKKPVPSLSDT
jgi:integrase